MDSQLDLQSELLAQKIKHYLITSNGRLVADASESELYQAFCFALREEIMINWLASVRTQAEQNVRTAYYLSMEYLPGRFMHSNVTNASACKLVSSALQRLGADYSHVRYLEPDPGLGNGGLGRLASCFMDSLATLNYPSWGYGLRYQYGTFEQQLWDGVQIERPDCWLLTQNPWEFRRDQRRARVKFCGHHHPFDDELDYQSIRDFEEVRALAYDLPIIGYSPQQDFSVVSLRLWTAKESPRNFELQRYNAGLLDQAAENTTLTDVLYPSDHHDTGKRIRLKQEFLLVSASIQDIMRRHLARDPDPRHLADTVRIQINDTHPALAVAEYLRLLMKEGLEWGEAWEVSRSCLSYTNHTIMKEALEEWSSESMRYWLPRQYRIIERLNHIFCNDIRERFPEDEERVRRMSIIENDRVRMAHLSIYGSHHVNGVAALHTSILKRDVFHDFNEMFPERFVNVTNGVTHRRWLAQTNPELASFITERIGDGWLLDFSKIRKLQNFACDEASQKAFLEIKRRNKEALIEELKGSCLWRAIDGSPVQYAVKLSADALFDIQIKRVHEYKRQLLNALHLIMLYQELVENPEAARAPRVAIFGGKAAAGYEMAKHVIRLICCLSRKIAKDPRMTHRLGVFYVENYNVSKAEQLIPAADLSEQISAAGWEASGTGNMKLSMNGALTIGTEDGANVEMKEEVSETWWPFSFGSHAEELAQLKQNASYDPWEFYRSNARLRRAVDALKDRSLVENEDEHQSLLAIYRNLMEGYSSGAGDPYFCLKDFSSYVAAQERVDALYKTPLKWAEFALHNIAGMGKFSTDNSIRRYAKEIWNVSPCPVDPDILRQVRHDFNEHDRCRVIIDL